MFADVNYSVGDAGYDAEVVDVIIEFKKEINPYQYDVADKHYPKNRLILIFFDAILQPHI